MLKFTELEKIYPSHIMSLFDKASVLQDQDTIPRFALTRVLVQLGKQNLQTVIPLLEKALQSDKPELRWTALQELLEIGKLAPQQAVSILEHSIKEHQPTTANLPQTRVLIELAQKNPEQIIPIFEKGLASHNTDLQWISILELIELAAQFPHLVIPVLERALTSDNPHLKWVAVLELIELAKHHPDWVIPTLTKALDDGAFCMAPLNAPHTPGTPNVLNNQQITDLKLALQGTNTNAQCEALLALTELIPHHAAEILPLFEEALQCHNPDLQWMVILELVKLTQTHPTEVIPILRRVLAEGEQSAHDTRVLIELGKEDMQLVLPCFEDALQLDNPELHSATILELFELLQIHLQKLAPLLKKALRDKNIVSHIEPHKQQLQQIINLLEKAVLHCHPDLQWTTLQKFLELQILEPQQILRMLENMMQHKLNHYQEQYQNTRLLVELGQQYPKLAGPIFRQVLADNCPDLQWSAILELVAIIRLCPQIMAYLSEESSEAISSVTDIYATLDR